MRAKRAVLNVLLVVLLGFAAVASAVSHGPKLSVSPDAITLQSSFKADSIKQKKAGTEKLGIRPKTADNGEKLVSVIVKLEDTPLAAYTGNIPKLAPTSPRITGAKRLNARASASLAYLDYLKGRQESFISTARASIAQAKVTHRYGVIFGGVAMLVPESQVDQVAKLPGVKAVYPDTLLHVQTDRSPEFIGAPALWDKLGGQENAGEGVVVGVLDTGVWPEHPSFSDPDPSGKPYPAPPVLPGANGFGPYGSRSTCDFGNTGYNPADAPFTCNNKLIGAFSMIDTYKAVVGLLPGEFDSARDDNGHGTHTSSTAVGNGDVYATLLGVSRSAVSGIAPRSHLVMYRVCGDQGCYSSDSVAAVQQAILDGVDVINFSISGGSDPYNDAVSLAFLDAYEAGVFVAASAGNSGPGADTVAHREPWTTTVAATTTDRRFSSTVTLQDAGGATLTLEGASVTGGIGTAAPVVPAEADEYCLNPFPPGTFTGQIVVCKRGINARVAKSYNVAQGGAVGMFLYNTATQDIDTDNHFIPTVHMTNDAGADLVSFLATHSGVTATFTAGTATVGQGDVMAAFSSRGGPGQALGVSKPDIAAPGVQILAGHTPKPATIEGGKPGELFQCIPGTSMSSPHVAGAAALLKNEHPDWTPGQIKSVLMSTATVSQVFKEDQVTPVDPFDVGSGRLDLNMAANPGLTFDSSADDYLEHENDLWNANYPSLYVPVMPGEITVKRTVRSVLQKPSVWRLWVEGPADLKVTVPKFLVVGAGKNRRFPITVDGRDVPMGETRHAVLFMKHKAQIVRFPITIVRREPVVTLEKSCDPENFKWGGMTGCTITLQNNSFEEAKVEMTDRLPRKLLLIKNSVTGAVRSLNGLKFRGTLAGGTPPGVQAAVDASSTPAGYLPLSTFGIPPFALPDEGIANFTVDDFEFGGKTYNTVGVVSNGYVVIGGGTGADVAYLNTNLPDAAPPNNILAPFWTDLNPSAGGNMYAGYLTDGVDTWLVIEWKSVPNYSNHLQTNSFQVWIGVGATKDISFAYGPDVSTGDGGKLTVGAENMYGNSGEAVYYNGTGTPPAPTASGYAVGVTSTSPIPGESHVVTYNALGIRPDSDWKNCAEMTSDLIFGINIDCASGHIGK
jgi:subtilisin family serine protease